MAIYPEKQYDEEVDPQEVRKYIVFKKRLNPKFWADDLSMNPKVRLLLLKVSMEFYNFIDLKDLYVEDIIVTGSNASYNYTSLSDLDVHLIVDFNKAPCPDLIENFFITKKTLWNTLHDIKVGGQNVEMYVQDKKGSLQANGIYSILNNEWVMKPKAKKPSWDNNAVIAKTEFYANEVDVILAAPEIDDIDDLLGRLKRMRQSGLASGGEFSTENLAYKSLRNLGYLDKLFSARSKLQDRKLSGM